MSVSPASALLACGAGSRRPVPAKPGSHGDPHRDQLFKNVDRRSQRAIPSFARGSRITGTGCCLSDHGDHARWRQSRRFEVARRNKRRASTCHPERAATFALSAGPEQGAKLCAAPPSPLPEPANLPVPSFDSRFTSLLLSNLPAVARLARVPVV